MEIKSVKRIAILGISFSLIIAIARIPDVQRLIRFQSLTRELWNGSSFPLCNVSETFQRNNRKSTEYGCSVSIYEASNERLNSSKSDNNCSLCNGQLLRRVHRQRSYFVSQGSWYIHRLNGKITHAYFKTPYCSFSNQDISSSYLENCFAASHARRILTLGDSNGRRTFDALKDIVSSLLQPCRTLKMESYGFRPDINYYLQPGTYNITNDIKVESRQCRTCGAVQYQCYYRKGGEKQSLIMEHIPINFISESSIRIIRAIENAQPTNSTIEFILRDYLRGNIPDILLIMTPCGHEWQNVIQGNKEHIRDALRELVIKVKKYIPVATQIYWIPYQYILLPNVTEAIHLCNDFIFEALRNDFKDPRSSMHATLDTFQLSCPFRELRLSGDPYHMQQTWYELYVRQILPQICSEL